MYFYKTFYQPFCTPSWVSTRDFFCLVITEVVYCMYVLRVDTVLIQKPSQANEGLFFMPQKNILLLSEKDVLLYSISFLCFITTGDDFPLRPH